MSAPEIAAPAILRMRLLDVLAQGMRATADLAEQLRHERTALAASNADALGTAAAAKQEALAAVEAVESARLGLLRKAAAGDPDVTMDNLLRDDEETAAAWRCYLASAADCQHANRTNGAVIRVRQQHIVNAITVLGGNQSDTYGPAGDRHSHASRALARA